jgi:hypothetical protein
MENYNRHIKLITERKKRESIRPIKTFTSKYFDMLSEGFKDETQMLNDAEKLDCHIATINKSIEEVCSKIDSLINEEKFNEELLLEEAISNSDE